MKEAGGRRADAVLDIKGTVCPWTFIKPRLALKGLRPGQVLKVVLDHEAGARALPRNVALDGHQVLAVDKVGPTDYEVWIRKHPSGGREARGSAGPGDP